MHNYFMFVVKYRSIAGLRLHLLVFDLIFTFCATNNIYVLAAPFRIRFYGNLSAVFYYKICLFSYN